MEEKNPQNKCHKKRSSEIKRNEKWMLKGGATF